MPEISIKRSLLKKLIPYRWLHWMLKNRRLTFDELKHSKQYFSQFGEDIILTECVFPKKTNGFYVDCGAYHPLRGSNTYLLWKRGWRGINLEPNPTQLEQLKAHRPDDINLGFAVSNEERIISFICDDVFSGIDSKARSKIAGRHPNRPPSRAVEVESLRLDTIIKKHAPVDEIDLLNIDCEGHDFQVLQSYDWSGQIPYCIVVERHGDQVREIDAFLADKAYSLLVTVGLSGIYIRKE
jgi:FkbM family methyltransferase